MSLVEAFVRNPVKVSVGVLLVALFGTIALFQLPIELTPEVQTPTITIETRWPGASPEEIEREIVLEQEEQVRSVESLTKLTSECLDSLGRITLEFEVGTDMAEALLKVNARLQQVREYPLDADKPVLQTANSGDRPIAWFILRPRVAGSDEIAAWQGRHPELAATVERARRAADDGLRLARLTRVSREHPEVGELLPEHVDLSTMRRFVEDVVETAFEQVPGVSNSNVLGGMEDELQVTVDPRELSARSLTIDDVRAALVGRNKDTSAGDFWEGKRRYVVRTLGRLRTPEEVEDVVVARRDGRPVYLRDVAQARLGFKKPDGLVRNFGTTSIAVNVQRRTGANVMAVMDGLRRVNRELNDGPLKAQGLTLSQAYDETEYIDSAIGLVQSNILVGGALTVLVLMLFLRSTRSTLVLALAIPTSLIGTFLVLGMLGRSLNVISLAGLAFAVGMLVDNAVVVLENVYRHWQEGKERWRAAVEGTQEVWGAVVASTLTTLAVFVPVLFVQEEAGQLFRDIAIAISTAVGLSLIVSVIVIPTATARILRRTDESMHRGPGWRALRAVGHALDAFGRAFVGLFVGLNAWLQRGAVRELAAVAVMVAGSLGLTWVLLPKVEYLPTGNRNLVIGILLPPPGYNLDRLTTMGEHIEEELRPYWDVDPDDREALAALRYPAIGNFFFVARNKQVFLGLRSIDPTRAGELVGLVQEVAADLPGMFCVAKQSSLFEQGLSAGRTVDVEITGRELSELVGIGRRVLGGALGVVPGSQVLPKPSLDLSNPEVHVLPRWDQVADLRIDARSLGYAVDAYVDGAYAADYYLGGDKIDLTIVGRERFSDRIDALRELPIAAPTGQLVPLGAIADIELSAGPEQINRRETQRSVTIEVTPPPEVALEDAMERIRTQVVDPIVAGGVSPGTHIALSGTADKLEATWKALRFNVILATLITYLLMAALFESWLYPLIVILSVPLGAVGGVAALRLLNLFVLQPLDVLTMLGFVILIGTAVNNAILIVHQSLNGMRAGLAPSEAIRESVRTRIRPIFMTTVTTVMGLVPLVLFPGAGSELYRGLGAVVLGGLVVSTLFTLVLVPTLFHLAYRGVRRIGGAGVATDAPSS